jgi:hypothetical protein
MKDMDKDKDKDHTILLMLAYLCITSESEASLIRKVEILDRFDLGDGDIAKVCSVSVQSIRNARHALKKKPDVKKKK